MTGACSIYGQSIARRALGRALSSGHLHHAWIFHGPSGVGKQRIAEEFARVVLDPLAHAEHRITLTAPSGTPVARMIDTGTHPDFHVIRKELAAVSESRELRERKQLNIPLDLLRERMIGGTTSDGRHHESSVFRTATLGHGKVFVIDESELLDTDAQNALLKTLEEPPAGTVVVLITEHEDRLLPTIRSRCQRLAFGPLSEAELSAWWAAASPKVPEDARKFVQSFAAGSPGMVLRAAEHGISAWNLELSPLFDALETGRFPANLGDRLATLVDDFAKNIVEQDENASKEAANRLASKLLAQLLGLRIREGLRRAGVDAVQLERWISASEVLTEYERHVRSNVNLKHAAANLVAQWSDRVGMATPGVSRGR